MRSIVSLRLLAVALLLLGGLSVAATSDKVDTTMKQVLAEYLKIQRSLAGDKEAGVAAAAGAIDKLAATVQGAAKDATVKQLAAQLRKGAARLKQARGLARQRDAFKELSTPMVAWARQAKPRGVKIVHCSMAKASWVQTEPEVRNPYYGSKMLTCGDVVSAGDPSSKSEKGGSHGEHQHRM